MNYLLHTGLQGNTCNKDTDWAGATSYLWHLESIDRQPVPLCLWLLHTFLTPPDATTHRWSIAVAAPVHGGSTSKGPSALIIYKERGGILRQLDIHYRCPGGPGFDVCLYGVRASLARCPLVTAPYLIRSEAPTFGDRPYNDCDPRRFNDGVIISTTRVGPDRGKDLWKGPLH